MIFLIASTFNNSLLQLADAQKALVGIKAFSPIWDLVTEECSMKVEMVKC